MYTELLAHMYSIQLVDEEWGDDTGNHGHCDRSKQEIKVVKAVTSRQTETLLHEMTHACLYEFGLTDALDDELEERVAAAVGQGLAQMLLSNRDLVDVLFPTRSAALKAVHSIDAKGSTDDTAPRSGDRKE